MKNCLILLTKVYPFDKGEEFIEDEIKELSNSFEKVILIATSTEDNAIQTRKTPDNFIIHRIKASLIKKEIVTSLPKILLSRENKKYLCEEEFKDINKSFKKRAYAEFFIAKGLSVYKNVSEILNEYNLNDYTGVTFYSYWLYDTALAAIKLKESCENKKTKCVSRAHRYDLYADKNSMNYIPLRYYLLENLDAVYPCSKDGSNYLKNLYPKYTEKIEVSYLGTKDHGISEIDNADEYTIVSCCHVSPVKRVELLAQALKTLNDSDLKLKWIHFGDGNGLDEIKEYSSQNLTNINFEFKGNVNNQTLMEYYKNHHIDLFVNTSSSEGLPVSIMEACSFGIPCIATDVGGTSEIVINEKTGLLLDVDFSPEELGNKIRYMATKTKEEKIIYRKNCRQLWLDNFFAKNNFKKFTQNIRADI